jgi:hypothetical protein
MTIEKEPEKKKYKPTTAHLTQEHLGYLQGFSARARVDGISLSASDVLRCALDRLRADFPDDESIRAVVSAHAVQEATEYPGRAKRGLPKDEGTAAPTRNVPIGEGLRS